MAHKPLTDRSGVSIQMRFENFKLVKTGIRNRRKQIDQLVGNPFGGPSSGFQSDCVENDIHLVRNFES